MSWVIRYYLADGGTDVRHWNVPVWLRLEARELFEDVACSVKPLANLLLAVRWIEAQRRHAPPPEVAQREALYHALDQLFHASIYAFAMQRRPELLVQHAPDIMTQSSRKEVFV